MVESDFGVDLGIAYGYQERNMATMFESPFSSNRLRRMEELYVESGRDAIFGRCDCTSYSYLSLSVVLFTVGTAITIFALGDVADGHVFSNLGHMWLIGPIFICSGTMVAVKCMLYLRRKSVIQTIIHRHQLFRQLQDLTRVHGTVTTGTPTPGPPSYEAIVHETRGTTSDESPPPSYVEAIALLRPTVENDGKSTCHGIGTVSCDGIINVAENIRLKP